MANGSPDGTLSRLSAASLGLFTGTEAVARGVSRKQLTRLQAEGVIERELPNVYRMTAVRPSAEQRLRAALLWAGDSAAANGASAGAHYGLEGARATQPEIITPSAVHMRSSKVVVQRTDNLDPFMIRRYRGIRVTGVEATLVAFAHDLDGEAFEVACEDARRRRLTAVPAMRSYLTRFGGRGLPGTRATRDLLDDLDPIHAARSTLEVKTRRLLVANRVTAFRREFPLTWNGRVHRFDFAFVAARTILETNGRRWHDDPIDYEHDNEKWSVPGRHAATASCSRPGRR